MSASKNSDAVAGQGGEFSSRVPRDEPETTKGHKPGVVTGPPEYHAETLPAGTAPSNRTFEANTTSAVPGQADNPDASVNSEEPETTHTSAADTLGGSTSADVHTGFGHPGQGMSSSEEHHDGKAHREKARGGLAGVGASGASNSSVDPRVSAGQRALDQDVPSGQRGAKGELQAEDREPVSAEQVAAERD
ncbi:MAG: hypothetical protein M1833_005531 [Piccolia ochrophora]|nr:MAG: hypothetical protein M1833_005531 [Piccolia ochrophora]